MVAQIIMCVCVLLIFFGSYIVPKIRGAFGVPTINDQQAG